MRYFNLCFRHTYQNGCGGEYTVAPYSVCVASDHVPSTEEAVRFCAENIKTAGQLNVTCVKEIEETEANNIKEGIIANGFVYRHQFYIKADKLPIFEAEDTAGTLKLHGNFIAPHTEHGAMFSVAVRETAEAAIDEALSISSTCRYGKIYSLYRKIEEAELALYKHKGVPIPQKVFLIHADIDGNAVGQSEPVPEELCAAPFIGRYTDIYIRQDIADEGDNDSITHILPLRACVIYIDTDGNVHGLPETVPEKALDEVIDFADWKKNKGSATFFVGVFIGEFIAALKNIPDLRSEIQWSKTPSPQEWKAWSDGIWTDITNAVIREMKLQCKQYLEKHQDCWEDICSDLENLASRDFTPGEGYRYIPEGEYVDISRSVEWNLQTAESLNAAFEAEKKRISTFCKKEKKFIDERACNLISSTYNINGESARNIWESTVGMECNHSGHYNLKNGIKTLDLQNINKILHIVEIAVNGARRQAQDTSWFHFAGTGECPLKSFTTVRKDVEKDEAQ